MHADMTPLEAAKQAMLRRKQAAIDRREDRKWEAGFYDDIDDNDDYWADVDVDEVEDTDDEPYEWEPVVEHDLDQVADLCADYVRRRDRPRQSTPGLWPPSKARRGPTVTRNGQVFGGTARTCKPDAHTGKALDRVNRLRAEMRADQTPPPPAPAAPALLRPVMSSGGRSLRVPGITPLPPAPPLPMPNPMPLPVPRIETPGGPSQLRLPLIGLAA